MVLIHSAVDRDGRAFYFDGYVWCYCPHDERKTTYQRPNEFGELCACERSTWPPRGRGRGESLSSPRRLRAMMRGHEIVRLRWQNWTWQRIAAHYGYKSRSGPYQLARRAAESMPGETSVTAKALLVRPAQVFRCI